MKFLLATLSILIFSLSLLAAPTAHGQINGGMSGSFFNPENDGTGLNVEILSDTFGIAYWYTYDLDGDQRWHLLLGDIAGNKMTGEQRLSTPLGAAEQCGGGGSLAARSAVAGIYSGLVQSDQFPATETIVLIAQDGTVAGISDNGMYFGVVAVNGANFSGRVSALAFEGFAFPDGDVFARVEIDGFRDGSTLNFDYQTRSRNTGQILETGSYLGQYQNLYELDFAQRNVAGFWRSDLGYRFDIDADGRVIGSGPGVCRYYGTVRPIDRRFNAATGRLLPANCLDVDGTVELTLIKDERALLVIASGDEFYFDIWRR